MRYSIGEAISRKYDGAVTYPHTGNNTRRITRLPSGTVEQEYPVLGKHVTVVN